jgi:hypothetical protein
MTPYETRLNHYVDGLLDIIRARGYTVIHAGDLRVTHEADLCCGTNPVRTQARQQWEHAADDRAYRILLESVAGHLNGFVSWPEEDKPGICVLPDRSDAARRFAHSHNLDYAALRAANVTDADIFAVIAAHEASHILGNNGGADDEAPTHSEYTAYALHTARLIHAGMNPATLMLVNHALTLQSFMDALRKPLETFPYDRAIGAATWALNHAHDPTVWDERADAFTTEAYDYLRQQDLRIQRNDNAALHEALRALDRTRMLRGVQMDEDNPGFADKFCSAADRASAHLRKKGHLTAHGPDDKLQAALLLRQATRSFRLLQNFAP